MVDGESSGAVCPRPAVDGDGAQVYLTRQPQRKLGQLEAAGRLEWWLETPWVCAPRHGFAATIRRTRASPWTNRHGCNEALCGALWCPLYELRNTYEAGNPVRARPKRLSRSKHVISTYIHTRQGNGPTERLDEPTCCQALAMWLPSNPACALDSGKMDMKPGADRDRQEILRHGSRLQVPRLRAAVNAARGRFQPPRAVQSPEDKNSSAGACLKSPVPAERLLRALRDAPGTRHPCTYPSCA